MERITDQAVSAAEGYFTRRLSEVRKLIASAENFEAASRGFLELAASWTPNALSTLLSSAMELSALEARESVFVEMDHEMSGDDVPAFANTEVIRQEFREQIEFLTQKRPKPTRAWTDAMHGDHDRAFVVAGVTNMAMLEEFHAAVISGAETYDYKTFAGEFDRLVEKYGWSYNGGRTWRIRTIFETNIRTSYMAGRLRQMRDPETVKLLPFWEYVHGDTREPLNPRPQHLSWNGLVLWWNDPWWDKHFPPNDWFCSCGVKARSRAWLKRMGKTQPDKAPETRLVPYHHKNSGQTVDLPEGVGFGWNYMPGDLWERGLVPSALIDEAGGLEPEGRHRVQIDAPESLDDLITKARPLAAEPLTEGLSDEDYVRGFLGPFGADIGRAVLWEDATGTKMPISDELFRDRQGNWKIGKRDRATLTPLIAETLLDPDEIWIGVSAKSDPVDPDVEELHLDRRYVRVDAETGLIVVYQVGRKWWEAITGYNTTDRKGRPDLKLLDRRRGGKLLWKRK
ncbi:PBECR2 nuclease fold domain-containing protein [uncultured Celeribacter sp.]|uniref:PBECR2 nuclease fold domain-containing protein n=1 Tax=uncultured Celeribacter sp. TaxID=1303376 RepID=UPI002AA8D23F|nr:PBECR2 nuclease fold domain-containing protein [uncultured Celeribacter sp.]